MLDFERALSIGLALRIERPTTLEKGLDRLLVLGVRASSKGKAGTASQSSCSPTSTPMGSGSSLPPRRPTTPTAETRAGHAARAGAGTCGLAGRTNPRPRRPKPAATARCSRAPSGSNREALVDVDGADGGGVRPRRADAGRALARHRRVRGSAALLRDPRLVRAGTARRTRGAARPARRPAARGADGHPALRSAAGGAAGNPAGRKSRRGDAARGHGARGAAAALARLGAVGSRGFRAPIPTGTCSRCSAPTRAPPPMRCARCSGPQYLDGLIVALGSADPEAERADLQARSAHLVSLFQSLGLGVDPADHPVVLLGGLGAAAGARGAGRAALRQRGARGRLSRLAARRPASPTCSPGQDKQAKPFGDRRQPLLWLRGTDRAARGARGSGLRRPRSRTAAGRLAGGPARAGARQPVGEDAAVAAAAETGGRGPARRRPLAAARQSTGQAGRPHQPLRRSAQTAQPAAVGDAGPRLFRETLDLHGHRLDAWITSLATRRLDELRSKQGQGLYVGAFGWVEDLEPAGRPMALPSTKPVKPASSAGWVHTPSPAHAATAAILRSGQLSHAGRSTGKLLGVDISSRRVREVDDLFEGIRQGQSLGAMLGYRFERALHDVTQPAARWLSRAAARIRAADCREAAAGRRRGRRTGRPRRYGAAPAQGRDPLGQRRPADDRQRRRTGDRDADRRPGRPRRRGQRRGARRERLPGGAGQPAAGGCQPRSPRPRRGAPAGAGVRASAAKRSRA